MKLKKILFSTFCLAVVIAATGFINFDKTKKGIQHASTRVLDPYSYYFKYVGPIPSSYFDLMDANNYELMEEEEGPNELCQFGDEELCAIIAYRYWNGWEWKPDFSDTSSGNISDQLFYYSVYGLPGLSIYLKDL